MINRIENNKRAQKKTVLTAEEVQKKVSMRITVRKNKVKKTKNNKNPFMSSLR